VVEAAHRHRHRVPLAHAHAAAPSSEAARCSPDGAFDRRPQRLHLRAGSPRTPPALPPARPHRAPRRTRPRLQPRQLHLLFEHCGHDHPDHGRLPHVTQTHTPLSVVGSQPNGPASVGFLMSPWAQTLRIVWLQPAQAPLLLLLFVTLPFTRSPLTLGLSTPVAPPHPRPPAPVPEGGPFFFLCSHVVQAWLLSSSPGRRGLASCEESHKRVGGMVWNW
jgi:hypothetical protein